MKDRDPSQTTTPAFRKVPLVIAAGVAVVLTAGGFMVERASSQVNKVALSSEPKDVTVVRAKSATYRPQRRYVGTLEPWVQAKVGPQIISAYVGTVLVRPGDRVQRGQVLATLDCRNATASSRAVTSQARAVQEQQQALAHQAARIAELMRGGFASANEIEQKQAESASKEAELDSTRARAQRATLEVNDCVLRAPFDGEVATRNVDPGAFIHPGEPVATVVGRGTVRVSAEVPETDFAAVAPGTPVRMQTLANGQELTGKVSRRSPAADPLTRTVHFEVDVSDPERKLPVGTTAELSIDVGRPEPATELPLVAASVRNGKATVFIAKGDLVQKAVFAVKGERGGAVFVDPSLPAGSAVVTEGRSQLRDGDRVRAALDAVSAGSTSGAALASPKEDKR